MPLNDLFAQAKSITSKWYNRFFFDDEAPAPAVQPQGQQPQGDPYQQQQQMYAPQQPYIQQPQAYQQPDVQQPPQQQQAMFNVQYQPPQRNRRAQQHTQPDNVVPISAYQQPHPQGQTPMQPQPQPQQAQMQQPQQQPQQRPSPVTPIAPFTGAARIISARGIGDCRSAITLLRNGDAVVIVMEGISDPAEMRRYVDTLSGACFSLNATITKVSRYGAYFLAPQGMAVYADQITGQMNGAGVRPPVARPAYQPQPNYQQQGYQPQMQQGYQQPQPYAQPQPNPYAQQQAYRQPYQQDDGFTPRVAEPEQRQTFYAREAQQAPQTSFSKQPEAYGYAPDEYREAAES